MVAMRPLLRGRLKQKVSRGRPLPPRRFPQMVKRLPAHGPSGATMPLGQEDPGVNRPIREEADTPAPRAAPPTPLLPDASTLLSDRVAEGFPRKSLRTLPRNPLLKLLQSDTRFRAPPPAFCLNDFLQSCKGSQHSSQSTPTSANRHTPSDKATKLRESIKRKSSHCSAE